MPDRSGWNRQPGFDLSGKRALVVGAERPAGAAIARAFGEAGADVAVVATDGGQSLALLAEELRRSGRKAHVDVWNVTDPASVRAGMMNVSVQFGVPSVVVTAFDVPVAYPIEQTEDDTFREVMAVIAEGTYYVCRAFLRVLPNDIANARIICLTNVFGERGVDNISAYAAAHGAVQNLVRALAQEAGARNGATVNGIATGWMTDTLGRGPAEIGQNQLMRFVPMRRFGEPDEVAPLAVLLASDAAGYISGQILHVDGGITTHL